MSVRRKIAALSALAGTAVMMGAGVASAAPQPPQGTETSRPDAPPVESKEAPLGKVAVDVPVGFADTGNKQFGSPSAPQKDAPVLGIGGGGTPPQMPAPPAPPQPTPPMPLPTPEPKPTPAPDQDKGPEKPGPDFPSPLGAVGGPAAGAGGMALKSATGAVGSKAQGLPAGHTPDGDLASQAKSKLPVGEGGPLGAVL